MQKTYRKSQINITSVDDFVNTKFKTQLSVKNLAVAKQPKWEHN